MKMRTLMGVLAAAAGVAFFHAGTACVVTDSSTGLGGSGGSGGDPTTSSTQASATTGGMGGAGGGGMACYDKNPGCGAYITDNPPEPWCDDDPNYTPGSTNPSYDLYEALADCTCSSDAMVGICAMACANSACAMMAPDAACTMCITDTGMMGGMPTGCGTQFNACANDI
jgi:hypothetical protein